jgi:hypothetical protein
VLVKGAQSLVTQERLDWRASRRKDRAKEKVSDAPTRSLSSHREKAAHSNREAFRPVQELQRTQVAMKTNAPRGPCSATRVRNKANRRAQSEVLMQPEETSDEENEPQRAQPAVNVRDPRAHGRAAVFQRSIASK